MFIYKARQDKWLQISCKMKYIKRNKISGILFVMKSGPVVLVMG